MATRKNNGKGVNGIEVEDGPAKEPESYQLLLKLQHPDCWMNEVTAATEGRLLVNTVYIVNDTVVTHVVAYAETTEAIDDLVAATRESRYTDTVNEVGDRYDYRGSVAPVGKATQCLLVEYDPDDSIHDALISRGFIPQEPLRVHDGYEYWMVAVTKPRAEMQTNLQTVAEENDAEITVQRITTGESKKSPNVNTQSLSDRQREVFELARARGYYQWPRGVSVDELAAELGIAKTTLLEHLRKAETKLLGPE